MQRFEARRAEPIRIASPTAARQNPIPAKALLVFAALAALMVGAEVRLQAMEISSLPTHVSSLSPSVPNAVTAHATRVANSGSLQADVD